MACDAAYADETSYYAILSQESVVMGTFNVALQRFAVDPSLSFSIDGAFYRLFLAEFGRDLYCVLVKIIGMVFLKFTSLIDLGKYGVELKA